ncbi:MAG TPA: hypothetical protein VG318_16710 [Actinomycetota bacterium]|nr:hypothetical protein [Actinomycetota bacterium]
MKAVKTIAALIFLTALGIVLVQPVLGADDEPEKGKTKTAAEPSEPPETPDGGDDEPDDSPRSLTLIGYPGRCLQEVPPATTGLVAARRGSTVSIGLPGRGPIARSDVDGDVSWSPSGRFLVDRGGQLLDPTGAPVEKVFHRPGEWQWSPAADCVVAMTDGGNLTVGVAGTKKLGRVLLNASVADFDLSPNGRRLALVLKDEPSLWIAELDEGTVRRVTESRASLFGWFSNRSVLFSKSPGSGKLRYADGRGRARVVKGAFASTTLNRCGGRVLLTALATESDAPLAELVSRDGRIERAVLPGTPAAYAGFSAASCSPDGGFVVASALTRSGERGPLVLLQPDGTLVRELVPGRTANPTWTSQGVLFVRFGAAGRGRLWFIPPNGAPAPTAYTVGAPTQYDWAAS